MIELGSGIGFAENQIQEPVSLRPSKPFYFDVVDRAELAVSTFDALGLLIDREWAYESTVMHMQHLHDAMAGEFVLDRGIVETFKPVDFIGTFTLRALIERYDQMNENEQRGTMPSRIEWEVWDQYTPEDLNRRSRAPGQLPVTSQARALLVNNGNPEGFFLTHLRLADQEKEAHDFITDFDARHRRLNLGVLNTADIIICNAQRVIEGRESIDDSCRLARQPMLGIKALGGCGIRTFGGSMHLQKSDGFAHSDGGVRFSVATKI